MAVLYLRRKQLAALLAGFLFCAVLLWLWRAPREAPKPQYIVQTVTEEFATSRRVNWQAALSEAEQVLVYRRRGVEASQREVRPAALLLPTNAEEMVQYTALLEHLKPGTAYEYKVGGSGAWSDWQAFTTQAAGAQRMKAIIFGDSQSGDYSVWKETAQAAWTRNGDAELFVSMGDLVDIGSHYAQWKAWFDGVAGMAQRIPVAPLSGNHENYLPGGGYAPASLYLALFAVPLNGPAGLLGQAYSFDCGNVHFAVLDSQEEELGALQPGLIEAQVAWLEADLARSRQAWKVVLTHRPLFQNTASGEANLLGRRFLPVLQRQKVDVVFTAHIHTYGRTGPLRNLREADAGTVFISTGRSGDKIADDVQRKNFEVAFDAVLDQPNYLVLETAGGRMEIVNYKQSGAESDRVTLVK